MQHKILRKKEKNPKLDWESGLTACKIKEALNKFEANEIGDGYYQTSNINGDLGIILDSFDFKKEMKLYLINELKSLKDKIASINL